MGDLVLERKDQETYTTDMLFNRGIQHIQKNYMGMIAVSNMGWGTAFKKAQKNIRHL